MRCSKLKKSLYAGINDAKSLGAAPPAKRSKKGKKKVQGLPSAADYLKVTPLQSDADILEEVRLPGSSILSGCPATLISSTIRNTMVKLLMSVCCICTSQ